MIGELVASLHYDYLKKRFIRMDVSFPANKRIDNEGREFWKKIGHNGSNWACTPSGGDNYMCHLNCLRKYAGTDVPVIHKDMKTYFNTTTQGKGQMIRKKYSAKRIYEQHRNGKTPSFQNNLTTLCLRI